MSWEALTAISGLLTMLVIGATAVLGMKQLTELQRASQFDGTDRLLQEFYSPDAVAARRYVMVALPAKLRDPEFRRVLFEAASGDVRGMEHADHPEILVLDYFERLGAYMHSRLLVSPTIFEIVFVYLNNTWPVLSDVIGIVREAQDNPYMYDRTEYLYRAGRQTAMRRLRSDPKRRPSTGAIFTLDDFSRSGANAATPMPKQAPASREPGAPSAESERAQR